MAAPAKAKRPKRPSPRSCLGPVSDLEAHLPAEWWRKLFNALYVKTDGDVVENVENTRRDVDFIVSAAAVQPYSQILDLCCGQGRHCLELARRGFKNVTGVDRSRYLVRLAKKRAQIGTAAGRVQGRRRAQPAAAGEQLRLRCRHGQLVRLLLQQAGRREGADRGRQDPASRPASSCSTSPTAPTWPTTSSAARGSGSTSTILSAASARSRATASASSRAR